MKYNLNNLNLFYLNKLINKNKTIFQFCLHRDGHLKELVITFYERFKHKKSFMHYYANR